MEIHLDEILPKYGLPSIPFGATTKQVFERFGDPDSSKTDKYGDLHMEFRSLGLDFTFWFDEGLRLGYLGSERATATLGKKTLIGHTEESVRRQIGLTHSASPGASDSCLLDDGSVLSWFDVDDLELTLWFEDGICSRVDWSCGWIDSETPDWPADS